MGLVGWLCHSCVCFWLYQKTMLSLFRSGEGHCFCVINGYKPWFRFSASDIVFWRCEMNKTNKVTNIYQHIRFDSEGLFPKVLHLCLCRDES
ncbi:unnamed protein product [Moneuplotes crassus]|uniref:Secreted protein n=1 Tax=Euplotes crassus TaxID=5936 RepID=A0AAD1XWF1_EUPCR|nr:unnamed protein product [Moneuplotes crassus]